MKQFYNHWIAKMFLDAFYGLDLATKKERELFKLIYKLYEKELIK